jgi:hypothetical protein
MDGRTESQQEEKSQCFVAYFDCLGFECILNASKHSRRATWNALQDKSNERFPLNEMILRAKYNPQRSPEIWSFWSTIDLDTLKEYAAKQPQQLANLIRERGTPLYTTLKQKQVIV